MAHVTHYQDIYYFSWTAGKLSLELNANGNATSSVPENPSGGELKKFAWSLNHFNRLVERIEKDWVTVYRETLRDYPLTMRYGIVPKSVIWKYYPDSYRPDTELGKARTAEFIEQVRAYKFREEYNGHHKKMTLALLMRYCKVAYLANRDQFKDAIAKGMSGLKMYRRFADGRDEGLSGLPLNSEDAFRKWYHSRRGGGHPWEIYRGGNTTHIDLGVIERHQGWSVFLHGSSTGRMVETVRIAMALVQGDLPVEIHGAEELMLRLLGMDNVGIIPEYLINHRAAQNFEKEDNVFDCAHLYDLPHNNRIRPFITWNPLTPLRPSTIWCLLGPGCPDPPSKIASTFRSTMEHSRNECANFRRLSGFASYFPRNSPVRGRALLGTYRHEPKSQRESVMKTTLIVIQNDADHADAKKLIEKLMGSSDSQDQARMVPQARLVEAYECTQWPRTAPTLPVLFAYLMDQHNLSRADLVPLLGTASRVSEVLTGKRDLSMTMVRRLRERFHISADLLVSRGRARNRIAA